MDACIEGGSCCKTIGALPWLLQCRWLTGRNERRAASIFGLIVIGLYIGKGTQSEQSMSGRVSIMANQIRLYWDVTSEAVPWLFTMILARDSDTVFQESTLLLTSLEK